MRVKIYYDFLAARGGAERVFFRIKKIFDATGIVAFVDKKLFTDESQLGKTVALGLKSDNRSLNFIKVTLRFLLLPSHLRSADVSIVTGIFAPLWLLLNRPSGRVVYYCHTPPKFAMELKSDYIKQVSFWYRPAMRIAFWFFLRCYKTAIGRADVIISNSLYTRKRLLDGLGVGSVVLYPPLELSPSSTEMFFPEGSYYLSMARLETAKRVDLIIDAFRNMPELKLVVASGGSCADELKRRAVGCANITFTGWVDDAEVEELYKNCIASIYLAHGEDFGMSPVESMAWGKPVIGCFGAGLEETVVDGVTGVLLQSDPSVGDVIAAVTRLSTFEPTNVFIECRRRASFFSQERFTEALVRYANA